ncbi:C40 family peptidase [Actinoallomurus rhizosphaericola]|uniref:C40 family peptidase n=1 Tax=Actinoallomurus rhizosphaericola TaxID=2952536 RepID=UPI0020938751|nr:C40 family peptidase [Actinoallomurus rhizosphaericola]MCO5996062.1 NlpC/P60 family protein [Actinoallomurus rhizosphaericola]
MAGIVVGAAAAGAGPAAATGPAARSAAGAVGRPAVRALAGCDVLQPGASAVAQQAVRAACSQLGVWYSWGGGHGPVPGATYGHYDGQDPASKNDGQRLGFDCSGLVRYAYYRATGRDILNGTADNQFHTGRAVARFSPGQGTGPLLPGDLLFWGRGWVHHVAIYLGAGQMVEAFQSGTHVRMTPVRLGGDYAGAVRVDGSGGGGGQPGQVKYWVNTFADAVGYREPNTGDAQGVLNKGNNYVYCKVWGAQVGNGGQFNHWWLRTDLDRTYPGKNGRGAYVSAYYLSRWGNDEARDVNGGPIPNC